MFEQFIRTEILIGEEKIKLLSNARVAVFGIGGVGSYVVEGLARVGIGKFVLVDNDVVSFSNINRQLIATYNTIGQNKVDVAKERILSINPCAEVKVHKTFYLANEGQGIIDGCNYVVDAIDTVSAKLALVEECNNKNIKIISCMGTGNKISPTMLEVSDISKTSICPLCRVMRRGLKNRGIDRLKVVYSKESPIKPINTRKEEMLETNASFFNKRQTPGSVSFVPSVAGLIIVSEVVKDLINL